MRLAEWKGRLIEKNVSNFTSRAETGLYLTLHCGTKLDGTKRVKANHAESPRPKLGAGNAAKPLTSHGTKELSPCAQ